MNAQEQRKNSKPWLRKYQFAKGRTGNAGGRPSGHSITAALRHRIDRATADKLADSLVRRAIAGDVRAAQIILDRTDGSVGQDLHVSAIVAARKQIDFVAVESELRQLIQHDPPPPPPAATATVGQGVGTTEPEKCVSVEPDAIAPPSSTPPDSPTPAPPAPGPSPPPTSSSTPPTPPASFDEASLHLDIYARGRERSHQPGRRFHH